MKKILCNRDIISKFILIEILYIFVFKFLETYLSFPHSIYYLIDLMNIILIITIILNMDYVINTIKKIKIENIVIFTIVFLIYCFITSIINKVDLPLILWAYRNRFRYFVLFFSIIIFLEKKEYKLVEKMFIYLQIPNFILSLIQFFILDCKQDRLGGIFGNIVGCNGYLNIYLCIFIIIMIVKYGEKEINLSTLIISCLSCIIIAALSELKMFFIELLILSILFIVVSGINKINLFGLFVEIVSIIMGVNLLYLVFPIWKGTISSISGINSIGYSIGGGYGISRLGAFKEINEIFFNNSVLKNLFGLGFGSCEYGKFGLLTSDFYYNYGNLNYRSFSHQMVFLETGYIGILFYLICVILFIFWLYKYVKDRSASYYCFGILLIVILAISFIYNDTFLVEIGYIGFIGVALPICFINNHK